MKTRGGVLYLRSKLKCILKEADLRKAFHIMIPIIGYSEKEFFEAVSQWIPGFGRRMDRQNAEEF